jgi:HTH-type transcriptional regulator / antitoxin HigA
LIERFEAKVYPIPEAPGYRVLLTLMENRGVKQADLPPIFGSRGIASEVYNGKRAISKAQAKKLGVSFGISPAVII